MSTRILLSLVSIMFVSACTSAPAPPPAENAPPVEPPAVQQPGFRSDVTLNQMMVSIIDRNSHAVWDAAEKPPTTDAGWEDLQDAAVTLAAGGNLTMVSGNGERDQTWTQQPEWAKHSQALADAGLGAVTAVQAKDVEKLRQAGDQVLLTCLNCHRQYRLTDAKIHARER